MMNNNDIDRLALNLIYDVDYDIGKESDPSVSGDETTDLVDGLALTILRFLKNHGVTVDE